MSNVQFISPTPAHYADCLEMIERFYAIDRYPFNSEKAKRNLEEICSSTELGRFWLLEIDSDYIGYLILTFGYSFEYGGRDAFIDEFYLHDSYRGRGIGTQVLKKLDEMALDLGVNAIHLEVERSNLAGNKLYERLGFKGNNRSLLTKILRK